MPICIVCKKECGPGFYTRSKTDVQPICQKCYTHPITPEDAKDQMEGIATCTDIEARHITADKLLCNVLNQWGFAGMVKVFEEMPKYCA